MQPEAVLRVDVVVQRRECRVLPRRRAEARLTVGAPVAVHRHVGPAARDVDRIVPTEPVTIDVVRHDICVGSPRLTDVDEGKLDAPLDVHRAARRYLVRDVERRGAQVAVGDRPVERREAVVGARDARGEREQILGVRIGIAYIEFETLTEALLDLSSERERAVVAAVLMTQHVAEAAGSGGWSEPRRRRSGGAGSAGAGADRTVQGATTLAPPIADDSPQVHVTDVELVDGLRVEEVEGPDHLP